MAEVIKTRQVLVNELQVLHEQYWDAVDALDVIRLARASLMNRIRDLDKGE